MMEDRLSSSLLNMGYQRLNSNAQGIYLYYRSLEQELIIVSVIHAINGDEINVEQYSHILGQIRESFQKSTPGRIQLQSLILTENPDKVKHFCTATTGDSHWIVDLALYRLMIYETQAYDFAGLRGMLEQLLEEEKEQHFNGRELNYETVTQAAQSDGSPSAYKAVQFTLVNMSIIIVNILVYIITHYTPVLGGADQMFMKGALSWYYVMQDNEYYRLLTSMFMHADISHILNNMIILFFIGANLEQAIGKLRYLCIYLGAGILAGVASIGYNMLRESGAVAYSNTTFSLGASGAIFGTVGALLYVVLINRGKLKEIGLRQIIVFVILSLYGGFVDYHIDQAAHIGGFLGGILLAALLYRRPKGMQKETEVL